MNTLNTFLRLWFAALIFTISAQAYAGHAWGKYHWERSTDPLPIEIGDNLDQTWGRHLIQAIRDWVGVDGVGFQDKVAPVYAAGKSITCNAVLDTVQVCNDTYGNNGWLGIAGIAVGKKRHIIAGYVKVNDTYYNQSYYDNDEWRQYVMCQEIGHAFGLGHDDENFNNTNTGTCMDYGDAKAQPSNLQPRSHDYEMLNEIYAHADGGGGGDDGGGGGGGGPGGGNCNNPNNPNCLGNPNAPSVVDIMNSIDFKGPAQWGRLVSGHGGVEVYELDLGKGRKIITHVTWAPDHADDHEH